MSDKRCVLASSVGLLLDVRRATKEYVMTEHIFRRCVVAIAALFCVGASVLVPSSGALAAERSFHMAAFGARDTGYVDLAWLSPGDVQPAGRSIMAIDGVYGVANLEGYLRALTYRDDQGVVHLYDWSRIAATVIDEPYWGAAH